MWERSGQSPFFIPHWVHFNKSNGIHHRFYRLHKMCHSCTCFLPLSVLGTWKSRGKSQQHNLRKPSQSDFDTGSFIQQKMAAGGVKNRTPGFHILHLWRVESWHYDVPYWVGEKASEGLWESRGKMSKMVPVLLTPLTWLMLWTCSWQSRMSFKSPQRICLHAQVSFPTTGALAVFKGMQTNVLQRTKRHLFQQDCENKLPLYPKY